ncbi:lamina-associated polypeptide 2, isoforms beta/delta/epsilon/gamma-like [Sycon ciliatum]|uniref:lamina-associated polypeptide 2, isoforms beta/delta/epsilon/gamma-like n=1 Tax=Sycon ciliatum TaxID=27933 RepID=UPI0031F6055D
MATLTVAQLKDELKKQKVPFEDGRLKKYYVDLYTNSRRRSAPPTAFSDDEDKPSTAQLASPKGRRSLVRRPTPSTPQKNSDSASDLDDDALRQELTRRGHTPGPITASTRDLYRRILRDSINADASGTPQKNASAPGTPAKKVKSKPLLLSDDEGTSETDSGASKSPSRRSRSSSLTRRRSEIEKLQLNNPGPRMADIVPDGASPAPLPRSRRAITQRDSSVEPEAKPVATTSSCDILGGSSRRQAIIMLVILIAMAISVVFALRYGINMPLPSVPKKR